MENQHERLRLAAGVRLGLAGNTIVHVPSRGSFVIDHETHSFLSKIGAGLEPGLDEEEETRASLSQLRRLGILEGGSASSVVADEDRHLAEFTDLIARRESRMLGKVVSTVGILFSTGLTPAVVSAGVALLLLQFVFWIAFAPVDVVASAWLDTPLLLLAVLVVAQSCRLLLHESGHYAVAWRAGIDPKVGVGIYFTGPVAYVDLTPLDVADKRTRLSADLAGLAVDGFFTFCFTIAFWSTGWPVLAAVSVMLASVSMASLHPTVKSDGYWAMRDLFDGRAVSATWASPRKLLHASRRADPAGRFARYLLAAYAVSLIWSLCVAPRWVIGIFASVSESSWDKILMPAAVCVVYLLIAVVAAAKTRRATVRLQ